MNTRRARARRMAGIAAAICLGILTAYAFGLDALGYWSMLVLLWVGTPAQALFVLLYLTRKWRTYKFSRAIMWKSGALALYLYGSWSKVLVAGLRPYDWPVWIDLQTPVINALVLWAIVNQLYALFAEIRGGDPDAARTEVNTKAADDDMRAAE